MRWSLNTNRGGIHESCKGRSTEFWNSDEAHELNSRYSALIMSTAQLGLIDPSRNFPDGQSTCPE
jgi:hypothetical protein